MKKTIDLLVYELDRIKYGYLGMVVVIFLLQLAAIFQTNQSRLSQFEYFQRETQGNIIDFVNEFGTVSFNFITGSGFYSLSIMLGIICLMLYAVIIWYRDWLGKNNLSYRLLTLPGSRMSIFVSKLLSILIMVFGLLAIQLIFMFVGKELLHIITPQEMYQEVFIREAIQNDQILRIVYPQYIFDFLLHYTFGIAVLSTAYTFILMERSFKWKGIVAAGICVLLSGTVFILFVESPISSYFFSTELLIFFFGLCITIIIGSFFYSRYLIEKKVTI